MSTSRTHLAWHEEAHASEFDVWAPLSIGELRRTYESFNEIVLFLENKSSLSTGLFVEVGCATGELYRYMRRYHSSFQYRGFDISDPAIQRARKKYPQGSFALCDETLSEVGGHCPSPSVVFSRDVVHHQADPWASLAKLISIAGDVLILRVRTRDRGDSVIDPELSCQWVHGKWVPFMVLNSDQVIQRIKDCANVSQITMYKHYQQLGGHNGRYLPKECYYPETGTAETALFIRLSPGPVTETQISVKALADSNPHYSLLSRGIRQLRRSVKGRR